MALPDQLTDEAFNTLLRTETDPLRLIILGWAAVEADINAHATEAFEYPLGVPFARVGGVSQRIAIATALGVIPIRIADALNALATLRHEFAHGARHDLTPERAAQLRSKFGEWVNPEVHDALEHLAPVYTVVYALNIARVGIQVAVEYMRTERARRIQSTTLADLIRQRTTQLKTEQPPAPDSPEQ